MSSPQVAENIFKVFHMELPPTRTRIIKSITWKMNNQCPEKTMRDNNLYFGKSLFLLTSSKGNKSGSFDMNSNKAARNDQEKKTHDISGKRRAQRVDSYCDTKVSGVGLLLVPKNARDFKKGADLLFPRPVKTTCRTCFTKI